MTIATEIPVYHLAVRLGFAYIFAPTIISTSTVEVINLSHSSERFAFSLSGYVTNFAIYGNYAIISKMLGGVVQIIDLTTPLTPGVLCGHLPKRFLQPDVFTLDGSRWEFHLHQQQRNWFICAVGS